MRYLKPFNESSETPEWAKGLSLEDMINNPENAAKFLDEVYKGRFYNSKSEGDKESFKKQMIQCGFKLDDIDNFLNKI